MSAADLMRRTTLKAISVRQPWASCIATGAAGAKRVENRGRNCAYRGPIAIHASLRADTSADTDPRVTALWGTDPRVGRPIGAVLAVAHLVDCHEAQWWRLRVEPCCSPWGERHYSGNSAWHLVLDNVRVLDTPIPARGHLQVPWTLPDDVAAKVLEQVGEARP
jgi:hypothetical protein